MALQGATSNFSGLVATRFFLGLCEAGTFPVYPPVTPPPLYKSDIPGMLLLIEYVVQKK